ncbi:hypothetical protein Tco_0566849 [Tanacetum coccineum]
MSNKKTTQTNLPTPEKPTDAIPQQPYTAPNYGSQYHMGGSSFPMGQDFVEEQLYRLSSTNDILIKKQQQLLLDEEALRETLEEEAMAEKEWEERIKQEHDHDDLFRLEFEVKSDSD